MAKVTIGLDDTQLNAGLSRATANVKRFAGDSESAAAKAGTAIKNAFALAGGIAAVQQLGGAVKNLLSEFDDIADAATRLGTSAESFQRIKLQAELAGASADGLTTTLLKMEAGLQRGGAEGEKLTNALVSLGINTAAFTAAKPEEKISMLAAAFQKARAEGRGLSEIQDLFKKQFTELIPLLSASVAELARIAGEKVVSNEDVKTLGDANDELEKMLAGYKVLAATDLAGLLKDFEAINNIVKSLTGELAHVGDALQLIGNPVSLLIEKARGMAEKLGGKGQGGSQPPAAAAAAAAAAALDATTTATSNGPLPGLEAATGFSASNAQIPGLAFAAPQSGASAATAAAEKSASNGSKFAKEQLDALKRNNEILEKLAAY